MFDRIQCDRILLGAENFAYVTPLTFFVVSGLGDCADRKRFETLSHSDLEAYLIHPVGVSCTSPTNNPEAYE